MLKVIIIDNSIIVLQKCPHLPFLIYNAPYITLVLSSNRAIYTAPPLIYTAPRNLYYLFSRRSGVNGGTVAHKNCQKTSFQQYATSHTIVKQLHNYNTSIQQYITQSKFLKFTINFYNPCCSTLNKESCKFFSVIYYIFVSL